LSGMLEPHIIWMLVEFEANLGVSQGKERKRREEEGKLLGATAEDHHDR